MTTITQHVARLNEKLQHGVEKFNVPFEILNDAKGLIFVKGVRRGKSIVGTKPAGIFVQRLRSGWSNPVGVTVSQGDFDSGFTVGKIDALIVINNERVVSKLLANGQYSFTECKSILPGISTSRAGFDWREYYKKYELDDAFRNSSFVYNIAGGTLFEPCQASQSLTIAFRSSSNVKFYGKSGFDMMLSLNERTKPLEAIRLSQVEGLKKGLQHFFVEVALHANRPTDDPMVVSELEVDVVDYNPNDSSKNSPPTENLLVETDEEKYEDLESDTSDTVSLSSPSSFRF